MTDASPDDVERKLRAKRYNEQVKLVATTLNTIALTLFGSAVVVPLVAGAINVYATIWMLFAGALHSSAHVSLRQLRSED